MNEHKETGGGDEKTTVMTIVSSMRITKSMRVMIMIIINDNDGDGAGVWNNSNEDVSDHRSIPVSLCTYTYTRHNFAIELQSLHDHCNPTCAVAIAPKVPTEWQPEDR